MSTFDFMEIKSGSVKTDTMKLYNVWDSTMTIKLLNVPEFLSYEVIPKELKPKQEGIILITYDTKKKNEFTSVLKTSNPVAGVEIKPSCIVLILGTNIPFEVE